MKTRLAPLVCALLVGLPMGADAQQSGRCEILSGEFMDVLERGTTRERVVLRGNARIVCDGGVELQADTAINHAVSGLRQFIGDVVYTDSLKSLVADRVDYYANEGLLHARGNVVLTDRPSGSIISGADLEYIREGPNRPRSMAIVTGRPHATLHRQERPGSPPERAGAPTDAADATPFEIDADRMELVGEHRFRAFGRVELEHGETRGFADEVEYDELDDRVLLTGGARVEDSAFTLLAERIEAFLDGEELREVLAERDGVLLADELRVEAPGLRVLLEDGEAQHMIATRSMPTLADSAETAELPQPRVIATEFWLTADSIEALAPGQRLREVYAVGRAYGEQLTGAKHPGLPESIAHDWLSGDTIAAYFVDIPVLADPVLGDSVRSADAPVRPEDGEAEPEHRTVLERLISIGPEGRARSVYRMQEDGQEDGDVSINYMVANRITLRFRDGEVTNVEAEGPLQGMHLQPRARRESDQEAVSDESTTVDSVGT